VFLELRLKGLGPSGEVTHGSIHCKKLQLIYLTENNGNGFALNCNRLAI